MANKKINQLVAKTTIQSTDLFPIGDATTGTLYKKTIADLQAAIGGAVISVNGLVGTVVLDADDILETGTPTNRYFTEARARASISLTTTGSSGASTYSSSTGVLNVPTYTLAGLGGITATFLSGGTGITYNSGTGVISYSGTVYTDTSIKALLSATAPLSFNSTTGAFSISQATTSTNGYLSSTDWNTFNGKQNAVTLTTTGTSGAATFSGGTLNIPQYQAALTNPVTGTGTSGYVAKWNSTSSINNSVIYDNGTHLGIGTTPSAWSSYYKAIQIGTNGTFAGGDDDQVFTSNAYYDGTWKYITSTELASRLRQTGGTFTFSTASSGTANSAITWNQVMTLNSSGNLGIGTGSPSYLLHSYKSQNSATEAMVSNDNTGASAEAYTSASNGTYSMRLGMRGTGTSTYQALDTNSGVLNYDGNTSMTINATGSSSVIKFTTNGFTERMRISAGGNIGIGTTSPSAALEVYNTSGNTLTLSKSSNYPALVFKGASYSNIIESGDAYMLFYHNNAERMRITAGGNILMGTSTDNGERLYVSGAIRATGTITANSDISLKKNLAKIENALEKVEQINGYTYEFKEDDSKRHAGVIAQEIQGVLPEIVNKGNDGILGVEYGNISALLIEAIKEQQAQINELKALLNK